MRQAIIDCTKLDGYLKGEGFEPYFVAWATAFDQPQAITALHFRAYHTLGETDKGTKPQWAALNAGDLAKSAAKLVIDRIKEQMRDGLPLSAAIATEDFSIKKMAAGGNVRFFSDLGRLITEIKSKPTKYEGRSLTQWVLRAWLPLRFWDCAADGHEAFERFEQVAKLIGSQPPSFQQFHDAWKNVRNRALRLNQGT